MSELRTALPFTSTAPALTARLASVREQQPLEVKNLSSLINSPQKRNIIRSMTAKTPKIHDPAANPIRNSFFLSVKAITSKVMFDQYKKLYSSVFSLLLL
jgi:hypothetical protein